MRHNTFLYCILERCYESQDLLIYGSGKRVQKNRIAGKYPGKEPKKYWDMRSGMIRKRR